MRNKINLLLVLFISFASPVFLYAKEIPAKPNPPRLVNDFTQILGAAEQQQLEQKLVSYFDSTSTQIAIVIEQSLEGDDLFDYCQRLATSWGIGEQKKNNGLLIYIALQDRKIRIHTGYGMEATITDALSKRIIERNIKPNFKAGNYFQGLDEATDIIIRAASGEYVNDRTENDLPNLFKVIIILIIILFIITRFGGGGRMRRHSGFGGPVFWGGTFGSGGFSSGGGFGGGGFGGFGGGGFGGGGSSGSW